MTGTKRQCERLLAIDLKRAEGLEITPSEAASYEHHLAECKQCRAERRSLEALASGDGPNEKLDDIARRRYVDEVLGRLDEPIHREEQLGAGAVGQSRRSTFKIAIPIAVAAAVALVIIVAVTRGEGEGVDLGLAEEPTAVTGRVVLVTGDSGAAPAVAVGEQIASGGRLVCGSGRTVLSLPTGVTISLAAQSTATARRLDDEALEIELDQGALLASATPGRDGPPFRVITRRGTVTVTGTVLAVEDTGDQIEVRVIRGQVSIDDEVGRQPRSVGPAEATKLGQAVVRPAGQEESATAWKTIAAFDLLDPGAGAVLDVRSIPAGAEVSIDGVSLGRTPVMAAVRAGHRKLELTLDGREPVREFVDVSDGDAVARVYDLHQVERAVAALADDAGTSNGAREVAATPAADPADLLARAQESRSARDWAGAARAYRELIRRFPGSAQASSALVSLAQIELSKLGKHGKALKRFDSYLSRHPGGPLALEALLGKARALRAMGRVVEERAVLERFLEQFPRALQAREARRRLDAITAAEQG